MPSLLVATTPSTDGADDYGYAASWRMLQIAEREVGRIILDIHDGPVQNIFAALSQLSIVQRHLARQFGSEASADVERLQRSISLLEHSLNEIRTFMGAFRPPEFERRDLLSVLEGLLIQQEEWMGKPIALDVQGELPDVSLPVKIGLYRILQEALSNSYRHGHADECGVMLISNGDAITMEVADNGVGFDPEHMLQQDDHDHIGIEGMQERVKILGGTFDIQSKPQAGTRVRVVMPCC